MIEAIKCESDSWDIAGTAANLVDGDVRGQLSGRAIHDMQPVFPIRKDRDVIDRIAIEVTDSGQAFAKVSADSGRRRLDLNVECAVVDPHVETDRPRQRIEVNVRIQAEYGIVASLGAIVVE